MKTTAVDTEVPNERSSTKVTSASQKATDEKRVDPELVVTSPQEERKEHSSITSFFIDTFAKI